MNDKDNQSPNPVAIEEWKLLSSIIARLEDVEYKMRSWLFTLITGLTIALYSKEIDLSVVSFFLIGSFLVAVFLWMDLVHRMPKREAIELSKEIEHSLRKNGPKYEGPTMSEALGHPRVGKREELLRMVNHTPYIQFFILIILLTLGYLLIN
jgi:ribose/xylose/arabinose/galactoside ABC-type transport system permease subunit